MADIAIRAENLSKQYTIGSARRRHRRLRQALGERVASPLRRMGLLFGRNGFAEGRAASRGSQPTRDPSTIWALRDLSLEINEGEVVGMIGPNGAGKSTLLKLLSRITEPTTGRAEIYGRVGSLLEVGTGFHAELTGRENIYLNGSILGMKKAEIGRKFDAIVDFSGVENFIDTPVKRYSSGMYVRLAFAVAAHLEPDILIVDEALAVGDAAFQKKCLGKMSEASKGGHTVLFVSHNMAAVQHLCHRAIVLHKGNLVFSGNSQEAIAYYLRNIAATAQDSGSHVVDLEKAERKTAVRRRLLRRLELYTDGGRPVNGSVQIGAPLQVYIYVQLEEPTSRVGASLAFDDLFDQRIFTARSAFDPDFRHEKSVGEQVFVCEIPSLPFLPGQYKVKVGLELHNREIDRIEDACRVTVVESDYYGTGQVPGSGLFVLKHHWRLQ